MASHFLTASYDGQIRAFDYSKTLVSSSVIHPAPITSLSIISSNEDDEGSYTIATSSHDLTAQISQFTIRPSGMDIDTTAPTSKTLTSLHLHTGPVSSVSSNSAGTHLLTSSWDGLIGLWDTSIPSSDQVPEPVLTERDRKKRRKIEDCIKPRRKAPLSVLKSHTARVSKVLFAPTGDAGNGEQKKAYSCGFDSTVRFWDTEHGVCEHTIVRFHFSLISLLMTKTPTHLDRLRKTIPRSKHNLGWTFSLSYIHRPNYDSLRSPNSPRTHNFSRFLPSPINAFMSCCWYYQFSSGSDGRL